MNNALRVGPIVLLLVAGTAVARPPSTVNLGASKDNTLIEPSAGDYSAGGGDRVFCGMTAASFRRRALLQFDLSSIPAGSTITAVTLTLSMEQTIAFPSVCTLHRVLADWGEGVAVGDRGGGGGAPAGPGDATWLHRHFSTTLWTSPGGDFVASGSASQNVDQIGLYSWSGSGMVADAQQWLNSPASNSGWILIGDESLTPSTKAFGSRENLVPASRPLLTITYVPPCPGDVNGDGHVNTSDLTVLLGNFGQAVPPGTGGDLDGSGFVNTSDLTALLGNFGANC